MNLSAYWNKLVRVWDRLTPSKEPQSGPLPAKQNSDPGNPTHAAKPGWLKLEFTNASHAPGINALFNSDIKKQLDPDDSVVKRQEEHFMNAIEDGHAIVLRDDHNNVYTTSFAYYTSLDGDFDKSPPDFIEAGTALALIGGYQTALLVGAALGLKEWLETEPNIGFASAIKRNNIASVKTFTRMGWEKTDDPHLIKLIGESCDQNLVVDDTKSQTNDTDDDNPEEWYVLRDDFVATKARILLEFMDRGTLYNKRTGEEISLDLTELETAGLTRARLEAMAAGETDKEVLKQISSSGSGTHENRSQNGPRP